MKIYGYELSGITTGEMVAAVVSANEMKAWGMSAFACDLGWEKAFTSFKDARVSLLDEMKKAESDPELIAMVQSYKASYVPVVSEGV